MLLFCSNTLSTVYPISLNLKTGVTLNGKDLEPQLNLPVTFIVILIKINPISVVLHLNTHVRGIGKVSVSYFVIPSEASDYHTEVKYEKSY